MLWRKGVGSSRGGGGSVICADMREHCCAEKGGVPIGGGLGGVRCRCRDASAARDARAQFQQAALTHLPYRLVIGDRLYEYLYACTIGNSHMRVIYASSTAVLVLRNCFCTVVSVMYSCTRTRNVYCSTCDELWFWTSCHENLLYSYVVQLYHTAVPQVYLVSVTRSRHS